MSHEHNPTAALLFVIWMYVTLHSVLGWGCQNCN